MLHVLIYGYGWSGRSLLELLEKRNKDSSLCGGGGFLASVYDENPPKSIYDSRLVSEVCDVYDFIFVCIKEKESAEKVRNQLISTYKIQEEKIKHIRYFGVFDLKISNEEMISLWRKDGFENDTFNHFLKESAPNQINISHNYIVCNLEHSLYDTLESSERFLFSHYQKVEPPFPILGVSYSLGRSGTTLMTQFLSNLGIFAYPPNFLKASPATLLTGFIYYSKILETFKKERQASYQSYFGNTDSDGLLGEYETSLSSYVPGGQIYQLPVQDFDTETIKRGRAYYSGITSIMQKPYCEKVQVTAIRLLEQICKKTLYIELSRDIYTHTLALVNLYRQLPAYTPDDEGEVVDDAYHMFFKKQYKKEILFSKEPIKYTAITLKNALRLREIEISRVEKSRRIPISYEEFCRNPKKLYEEIIEKLKLLGFDYSHISYKGEEQFTISNRIPNQETIRIVDSVFSDDSYNIDFEKGE